VRSFGVKQSRIELLELTIKYNIDYPEDYSEIGLSRIGRVLSV
jgi:hypothetical protein